MTTTTPDYDSIVVGTGFSGIHVLWQLKQLGHKVKCFETGSDAGGVWYWNRYPGARTDIDGRVYSMNFSDRLKDLWTYKERYPSQPEVHAYLSSVIDEFDLRGVIQFSTRVASANFSEANKLWTITTDAGEKFTSRFFLPATGPMSAAKKIPFAGLKDFKGEWYRSSTWPKDSPNLKGKRVAIIGTGATGVQLVPKVATVAKELFVFQRTPQYVLPGRNFNHDDDQIDEIRDKYNEIWTMSEKTDFGLPMVPTGKKFSDMKSDEDIERAIDRTWEAGGFHMMFESFDDVFTNIGANTAVSDYLKKKIRVVVEDPETAELLTPNYTFLTRRPPCGHGYYEAFNRPNVKLVDISKEEIDVYESGIKTVASDALYEVHVIIFALGFNAGVGALSEMDVRVGDGPSLGELWQQKVETFAGMLVPAFPNMFVVCGPHMPFGNMPLVLDLQVNWIGALLQYMKDANFKTVNVTDTVAQAYCEELAMVFEMACFAESSKKLGSWFVGGNIPGRVVQPLFYFAPIGQWKVWLDRETEGNWKALEFSS